MKPIFILAILLQTFCAYAQKISPSEKAAVIDRMQKLIAEHYVITDHIAEIDASIQPFHYTEYTDTVSFLRQLNADLFAITQDKHLHVEHNPALAERLLNNAPDTSQAESEAQTKFGFEHTQILDYDIFYFKLTYFAHDHQTISEFISKLFASSERKTALIIDLRGNTGGSGAMVQQLCSYVLTERDAPILNIHYRDGRKTTLKTPESAPRSLYSKPLYILCDNETFSAAEGFAFILKNRKRAVIIGETTAGAGNIAGPYPIDRSFVITIPVGVITDPMTNTGWERHGVVPDVPCAGADALKTARQLAAEHVNVEE